MKFTCGVILYDPNTDKVLCCHPTNHPQDVWSIPKGVYDEGKDDDYRSAAIRELQEETNIRINKKALGELTKQKYSTNKKTLVPFYVFVNQNTYKHLQCNSYFFNHKTSEITSEVDKFKWFDFEIAISRVHPTQANSLVEFKQMFPANVY